MRKLSGALLLSLLIVALPLTAKSKKSKVPAVLEQATYVALGYETAGGFVSENDLISPKILPQDREVLDNVRAALQKWHKYIITINPREAQLLIAVRSGRLASANGGIRVWHPNGGPNSTSVAPVFGGDVGPSGDYLAVYMADDAHEGTKLWQASEDRGLEGDDPPLFAHFRKDVESIPTATKKP